MIKRIFRPLDRYIFGEFSRIFFGTALGMPILLTIVDLTDNLDKYLNRNLPKSAIALSYLYWIPDSMFMALPAAVLFATVFTIGALTRHAEVTAAKASGISFYRLTVPIFVGALMASGLTLWLSELAPITNKRRGELLQETRFTSGNDRFNFAYAAERGRVYKISALNMERAVIDGVEIERKGRDNDASYPSFVIAAETGHWSRPVGWTLRAGSVHVMPTPTTTVTFAFDSLRDRQMEETPRELMASARAPQDMGYEDLGKFIAALERSGGNANELRVERMLKLAVPFTCVIIALFGAPLATSTQRGGTAYGVGISLGTTVVFLVMIQLTKAIGGKGLLTPELAAWLPNILFGVIGLVMLSRTRT